MLDSGPPGFGNAPTVKFLMIVSAVLTFFVSLTHTQSNVAFQLEEALLASPPQLWRIVTSQFVFTSSSEVLFGFVLLYYFRIFERQMGSRKFAFFVLFMMATTTLIYTAILVLFPSLVYIIPGPYPIIFGSFILFFADIPIAHHYTVQNITFTDKSFVYFLGFQMFLCAPSSSIVAGFLGLLCGFCYRMEVLRIRRHEIPESIAAVFRAKVLPLLDREQGQSRALRHYASNQRLQAAQNRSRREADDWDDDIQDFEQFGAASDNQRAALPDPYRQMPTQVRLPQDEHMAYPGLSPAGRFVEDARIHSPRSPLLIPSEPSEANVSELVSMGFSREDAYAALLQFHDDIEVAANHLLSNA